MRRITYQIVYLNGELKSQLKILSSDYNLG